MAGGSMKLTEKAQGAATIDSYVLVTQMELPSDYVITGNEEEGELDAMKIESVRRIPTSEIVELVQDNLEIDDEPTDESDALITSGSVKAELDRIDEALDSYNEDITNLPDNVTPEETGADLYICDENGNVIGKFVDGHIVTKNFDSSTLPNALSALSIAISGKIASQQDVSDAGKALVIGSDGAVAPAEIALEIEVDATLTQAGEAADAKAVGDALANAVNNNLIRDVSETSADLYVCDSFGNVLAEFKDGHIVTKNFNSANIGKRKESEINLESYDQIPYNLENGNTWAYSASYKGILVPAFDLSYTNKFYSGTYKLRFAFLRSSEISANTAPDYCLGTGLITLTAGLSKYYEMPSDCKYVYIYISDGTYFGQMGVIRLSDDFDVVSAIRNSERPAYVASVEQSLLTAKHMNSGVLHDFVGSNVSDGLLTFAHISDLHNDPTNYTRFLNLLNEYDDLIDFGVVSGDLVDSGSSANFSEMIGCESVLNGNVPVYKCVGNHETGMTLANLYTAYQPGSGDGSLYFSKDFSDRGIRVIFLNQYDNESSTRGNTGHYSQEQINWFIDKLQDAITNSLSVIVVLHSMGEAGWPLYNKQGFYQQVLGPMYGAVNSDPIISEIINAFKHKGNLTKTYTYTDGSGSISVSAAFNGYGKFVCYIAGHEHVDVIGYSAIYPDQLICLVQGGVVNSSTRTEAQAHWQSKYDTPRVPNTVTSDSINVYSIDTAQKLVKVVKIGSTVTDKFETRSFAVFGY